MRKLAEFDLFRDVDSLLFEPFFFALAVWTYGLKVRY